MTAFLERLWYGDSAWQRWLAPLSGLFGRLVEFRRRAYRDGRLRSRSTRVPVIVVGNITVGGTGKTPVALWLAERLKALGSKPGIVSRGYGGHVGPVPVNVTERSDPAVVGDEPLLMARRVVCPVAVHPDRFAAAELLAEMGCDVVIADDGLQHYGLARQFEIAVVDGRRGFGNGRLLPAGPLREPVSRLQAVDRILLQGGADAQVEGSFAGNPRVTRFTLAPGELRSLHGGRELPLASFAGKTVHAVAAIGNPRRFFDLLESHGLNVIPHAFADHAALSRRELEFGDEHALIMTEKDAVKCESIAPPDSWYLTVTVDIAADQELAWLDGLAGTVRARLVERES